jgi:hypothetical protein
MKHSVTKAGKFPYVETLSKKSRIKGVPVSVTAKRVVRGAFQND